MAIGVCKCESIGVRCRALLRHTGWHQVSSPGLTQCSWVNRAGAGDVREADLVWELHKDHRVCRGLYTGEGTADERWILTTDEWASGNRKVHSVAISLVLTVDIPCSLVTRTAWALEHLAVLDVRNHPCLPLVVVDTEGKATRCTWVDWANRTRWQPIVCTWVVLIVVLNIHQHAEANLLHVRQTGCLTGLFTGLCKYWEKNSCQNGNNSNHNQEFDKRKCALSRCASHIRSPMRI